MIFKLLSYIKNLKYYLLLSFLFAYFASFGTVFAICYLLYLIFEFNITLLSAIIFILIAILLGLSNYFEHYFGHLVAFKLLSDFRIMVYNKLREIAPAKMDNKESSKILSIIHTDIENVEVFFAHTIVPLLDAIAMTITISIIYIIFFGYSGLISFISYIIIAFIIPFYKKYESYNNSQKVDSIKDKLNKKITEDMNGKYELQEFNLVNKEIERLNKITKEENYISDKIALINLNKTFINNILIFASWAILHLLNLDNLDVIRLILILAYPFTFTTQLALSKLSIQFSTTMKCAENLLSFLSEKSLVNDGIENISDILSIRFDNVIFSYPNTKENTLENLSINFTSNKIIGIEGESGIGKSTIVKLIMKWYSPTNGTIYLNNTNIDDISKKSIRNHISYVSQNPYIFNGNIRDNLTLGKDYPDELINEKIKEVLLDNRMTHLQDGLNTKINKKNIPFSSGELQRFELIRALLADKAIMILDEPTSNLDLQNEQIFLDILKNIKNKTIFIISHRKSTIEICDEIFRYDGKNIIKVK
ncbi:MAG: ABC transporter ATP-binding protein [Helcococcus sp.]|nr:ABC transporter ATP-binding protein [Helcococcus sp.]